MDRPRFALIARSALNPERGLLRSGVSDDPLACAWEKVLEAWDEAPPHAAYIELAAQLDRLAEAGRAYRDVRDSDPEREERAAAMIEQIIVRAVATMDFRRPETAPRHKTQRRVVVAVAMIVAALLIGTAYIAAMRQAAATMSDPTLGP